MAGEQKECTCVVMVRAGGDPEHAKNSSFPLFHYTFSILLQYGWRPFYFPHSSFKRVSLSRGFFSSKRCRPEHSYVGTGQQVWHAAGQEVPTQTRGEAPGVPLPAAQRQGQTACGGGDKLGRAGGRGCGKEGKRRQPALHHRTLLEHEGNRIYQGRPGYGLTALTKFSSMFPPLRIVFLFCAALRVLPSMYSNEHKWLFDCAEIISDLQPSEL